MCRNLPPSAYRDVIERPVTLEPRKRPLNGLALRSESLVPRKVRLNPFLCQQL